MPLGKLGHSELTSSKLCLTADAVLTSVEASEGVREEEAEEAVVTPVFTETVEEPLREGESVCD